MDNVTLRIDGQEITAPVNSTILEAAQVNGIDIPTLCYLKDINKIGSCRICLCEVNGDPLLQAACVLPVTEGMVVWTKNEKVVESRRQTLELLISDHRFDCTECERGGNCELQVLCKEYGVDEKHFGVFGKEIELDTTADHLVRDNSRCIQCRRCVALCKNVQGVDAIGVNGRGGETHIGISLSMADSTCVHCGMCVAYCPVGALVEKDDTFDVWKAITDKKKHVIAAVSPAVAVQLGECFGEPPGTDCTGRLVSILHRLGFDRVFSIDHMADVTVLAERDEFIRRKAEGALPLISAMCPSWVEFCAVYHPELKGFLSGVKSVQTAFGELCKSVYAEKSGISPGNVFVVSLEPCIAGKASYKECDDIDVTLTPNEVASMIKRACVSSYTALEVWNKLPDEDYDEFPGETKGRVLDDRGGLLDALRAMGINAIHVSGLKEAEDTLKALKAGDIDFEYIEVMACPGGCINGGGQAHQSGNTHNFTDLAGNRAKGLGAYNSRVTVNGA